jgi:hypothetical protein
MFHKHHAIATAALSLALSFGAPAARAETTQYYGRWTVSDDKPAFSTNGKLYKTIDMAPCGKDFCGIAVDDKNHCGKTLFRFFTTHAKDDELTGHGLWGSEKKKLIMGYATPADADAYMYLGLGADDMDLGGREGSEPTFDANYKKIGKALCTANTSNPQT